MRRILGTLIVGAASCGGTAAAQEIKIPDDAKPSPPAIVDALDWLARHQGDDGYWHAGAFDAKCQGAKCDGFGDGTGDVGVTALAVLAFLGNGETHAAGPHRATVKNAAKFLRDVQDVDGFIGPKIGAAARLGHAYASLATAELYGMTGSKTFKPVALAGARCTASLQAASGGWKLADADAECDVELTAVCVLALRAAKMAEIDVDAAAFDRAVKWLDSVTDAKTGAVRATAGRRAPAVSDDARVAAAAMARTFARFDADALAKDAVLAKQRAILAARSPAWPEDGKGADVVAWSFASLALFQQGGDEWKRWWTQLDKAVVARRRTDKARCDRGSWDAADDRVPFSSRVASTAVACRMLETSWVYGRIGATK